MKIKGATTVLNKEREFLGLTWEELLVLIQRNPYAFPNKVIDAHKVYTEFNQKRLTIC
tara:strand:+ start:47 stop:220 length:174 start_codon:yes stop_codon:yes gene_type:complete